MVLDSVVKQRINNARDILVGKVPDPKAQIEQITIALIYKFMDDMEKKLDSNIYFTKGLEEYSWDKVINEQDSATFFQKYSTAIELFSQAEHFPYFFKEIFKNAYVPYKDSRTLKLFLNEISYFDYEHSEKLGDAFEYLLSVMSSQGDAGQFRTPRHIIDFIVDVLEPKIGEKILDPACGTAGFLISAVKYMESQVNGKLSGIEINNIRDNLFGFDISPDMVRLGLVNMFLHGFYDSNIEEFDTLSNDDSTKWNAKYDLILANPPFMTPKGGVEPHDLLLTDCDSKRAEVLFTHYIATHLKSDTGRAGIIVSEGIIFQSGRAYKKLRKELVEKGLYAVVSLPSGIFNPYSGVKTSILLIDNSIKSDNVLFVKIENDGYHLGAQRRAIDKNDLPSAKEILLKYRKTQEFEENSISHFVSKQEIAHNTEYNLSGERYKSVEEYEGEYPLVELGEVCEIQYGERIVKNKSPDGIYPVYGGGGITFYTNRYNRENEFKISRFGVSENCVSEIKEKYFLNDSGFTLKVKDKNKINYNFIKSILIKFQNIIFDCTRGHAQRNIDMNLFKKIKIPLPPLDVQQKIVEKIENYQKIIDGAKQVVENYSPQIQIDKNWEMKELGEVCDVRDGTHESPKYESEGFPLITSKNLKNGFIDFSDINLISKEDFDNINKRSLVEDGDIIMPMIGTIGNPIIVKKEREFAIKNVALIKRSSNISNSFIQAILSSNYFNKWINITKRGGTQNFISLKDIRGLKIPLPPLEIQEEIVKEIEKEQELVDNNKQLIEIFEKKIEDEINKVWNRAE